MRPCSTSTTARLTADVELFPGRFVTFLTIFTAPKPFIDPHIATIQRNAIRSWLSLGEEVEVMLVGNEKGMAEVAGELGVRQIPEVACNEKGTPLVSSIFSLARQASDSPLLVYANADIILFPDLTRAARVVSEQRERFLVIGQRWDMEITVPLDFSAGWEERLGGEMRRRGRLHPPAGSDYFLFPRALFTDIPDFTIGRAGWDNWMIYHAREQATPVIDGTPSIRVIHQNHDYSHLPGKRPHYDLPESAQNEALAGGATNLFMVLDSDKQLVNGQVRSPQVTLPRLLRRTELIFTPPGTLREGWRWKAARSLRRMRRRVSGS